MKLDRQNRDVYFACAEYSSPLNRKGENAIGAYTFWLDVDCGKAKSEKGQGYETPRKAMEEFQYIFRKVIPQPSIAVFSGNGYHIYWVFEEMVERDIWINTSNCFKELINKLGFMADPNRTADIASILRVPGTRNFKDANEIKHVSLKFWNESIRKSQI